MALPATPTIDAAQPPQIAASEPDKGYTAPSLATLKRYFTEFRDLTVDGRTESLTDIDYYDSEQYTSAEKDALAKRKQPNSVYNRIKPAVNGMIGVQARGRADPRAWPRTPNDEGAADCATDVLRYVADWNRLNRTKLDCLKDMLVPGTMAVLVGADRDLQVTVTQVRWEEFVYDPRSRRPDFKDARYLGLAKWMYADDVASIYPDKAGDISSAVDGNGGNGLVSDESFMDRPDNAPVAGWVDKKQRRILIVELFYREGDKWLRCVFHGGGILDEGLSPYLDHKKRPHCPIEAQSAYVSRKNWRYGVVRDMRGPQDGINKRKSKLLHLVSVSQIQASNPSAIDVDAEIARVEAAKPDGVIPFGWEKVSTADMAAGQAQLLAEDKYEIERMGPNPAVLGRDANDSSGRALLARQQAGLVELAPLYAGADDWELRVYRQIWARVKQYWTEQQFIRVTDDEGAAKFVGVNQPIHEMAPVIDPRTGQPMLDEQGEPKQAPVMYARPQEDGTTKIGPRVLGYQNQLGEMDVDIEVDTQQDIGTVAQEQLADLLDIVRANPIYAQYVPFEVLVRLSKTPHKKELLDQIKAAREEIQKTQGAVDAQKAQMEAALAASQVEERKAKATQLAASADAQRAKAALDLHNAHVAPTLDALHAGIQDGADAQAQPPGMPPTAAAPQPQPFGA